MNDRHTNFSKTRAEMSWVEQELARINAWVVNISFHIFNQLLIYKIRLVWASASIWPDLEEMAAKYLPGTISSRMPVQLVWTDSILLSGIANSFISWLQAVTESHRLFFR